MQAGACLVVDSPGLGWRYTGDWQISCSDFSGLKMPIKWVGGQGHGDSGICLAFYIDGKDLREMRPYPEHSIMGTYPQDSDLACHISLSLCIDIIYF